MSLHVPEPTEDSLPHPNDIRTYIRVSHCVPFVYIHDHIGRELYDHHIMMEWFITEGVEDDKSRERNATNINPHFIFVSSRSMEFLEDHSDTVAYDSSGQPKQRKEFKGWDDPGKDLNLAR